MAAVSRSVLLDDGVPAFLVLLVLLLAISLIAVIRLPRWAGPSEDDTQDEPGHPRPRTPGTHEPVPGRRKRRPVRHPVGPSQPVPPASPASRTIRPGTSPARCTGEARSPRRRCPAARLGNRRGNREGG